MSSTLARLAPLAPVSNLEPALLETRLLIAAAHELSRSGLVALAQAQPDMTVVAEVGDPERLEAHYQSERPDVAIVDFDVPAHREATARLLRLWPSAIVLAVGTHEGDESIRHALETGIRGYLPKSLPASEIFAGVRTALRRKVSLPSSVMEVLAQRASEPRLTARERDVLGLVAHGRSNACIATSLDIAIGTVKVHIKAILGKLGAADRTEATAMAFQRGFVRLQ